ncbi:F-box protein [Cardamine amara subsp. amara]|uniref:F-box protein n=1 Tax=Cardamine amara subsp. amara TaxID=228776 RepID=A0ABD1A7P8_CARAN
MERSAMAEKTGKILRTSKSSSKKKNTKSQTQPIPRDITFEILLRLPAKSIVRYRAVSKLWSYITTTPSFIKNRAALSPPCVLLIFRKHEKLLVFSSPLHQNTYSYEGSYQITVPDNNGYIRRFDSVHGLILLEGTKHLVIWNPTVKRFFPLPEPHGTEGEYFVGGFLGYEPIEGKYKVLCIFRGWNTQVLTLGAQESWRVANKGAFVHWPTKDCGRCINGVIYYKAFGLALRHAIISFDLRSEEFKVIEFPMLDYDRYLMVSYEGSLGFVSSINAMVEIWSLKDAESQMWSYRRFLLSPSPSISLRGVTDAGELIYTERSLNGSLCVVHIDPMKNTTRETKFLGANGEVWRPELLGFDLVNDFSVLPNHVESFLS